MAQDTDHGTRSTQSADLSTQETLLNQTNSSKIECKICGFASDYSIISHVTRRHKMTTEKYRIQYPGEKLQIIKDEQRKKLSIAGKQRLTDSDALQKFKEWRSYPSEIKHWLKKGFTNEESIEKVTQFQKRQAIKGDNDATREKYSLRSKGTKNPMSLESISKRNNVSKEEARLLTPCFGRVKEKHPMFGKHHTSEALEKIAKNTPKTQKNRAKAEDEIANQIRHLGWAVRQNVGIGRYNVDLLIDDIKLVIEYFGDLWHCNPSKFKENDYNKRIKLYARERWHRDETKIVNLANLGYNILVIWEADWKASPQLQIKRVQNAADTARRLHRKN